MHHSRRWSNAKALKHLRWTSALTRPDAQRRLPSTLLLLQEAALHAPQPPQLSQGFRFVSEHHGPSQMLRLEQVAPCVSHTGTARAVRWHHCR